MRKLLQALLIVQILAVVLEFFLLLSNSLIYAIIVLAVGLLGIVPIVAILCNIDDIEYLQYEVQKLRTDVKRLQDSELGEGVPSNDPPSVGRGDSPHSTWTCVKCATVNKEGASRCANCKAEYSSAHPTDDPNRKKKISRWVK